MDNPNRNDRPAERCEHCGDEATVDICGHEVCDSCYEAYAIFVDELFENPVTRAYVARARVASVARTQADRREGR